MAAGGNWITAAIALVWQETEPSRSSTVRTARSAILLCARGKKLQECTGRRDELLCCMSGVHVAARQCPGVVAFAGRDGSYLQFKWQSSKPVTVQVAIQVAISDTTALICIIRSIPLFLLPVSPKRRTALLLVQLTKSEVDREERR